MSRLKRIRRCLAFSLPFMSCVALATLAPHTAVAKRTSGGGALVPRLFTSHLVAGFASGSGARQDSRLITDFWGAPLRPKATSQGKAMTTSLRTSIMEFLSDNQSRWYLRDTESAHLYLGDLEIEQKGLGDQLVSMWVSYGIGLGLETGYALSHDFDVGLGAGWSWTGDTLKTMKFYTYGDGPHRMWSLEPRARFGKLWLDSFLSLDAKSFGASVSFPLSDSIYLKGAYEKRSYSFVFDPRDGTEKNQVDYSSSLWMISIVVPLAQ